jgi:uncharacterized damage-inducible protein DinB
MLDELLAAWRAHEAVNNLLLDNIPDGGLEALALLKNGQSSRGRNVGRQLAHVVDVRTAHLREREKAALHELAPLEKGATPDMEWLRRAFAGSSAGIELRLAAACDGELVRKRGPAVFLGYLIAHESHHRGQVVLALKQSGFAPNEALRWGIWERWFK